MQDMHKTKAQLIEELAELRASEQFNNAIIANAGEGIIVFNRELCCQVWNDAMEELTGLSAQEVLGKLAPDLFPNMREHGLDSLLQRALSGETVRSPDVPFNIPRTEKTGWVEGSFSPRFNNQGEIIGVVAAIRDVTERVRAEDALRESKVRSRSLFDNVPVGLYRVTPQGRILDANPALVEMLGYPDLESLLAVNLHTLYVDHEDDQHWRTMLENEETVRSAERQLRRHDGTAVWARENIRVVRDDAGQALHYEASVEDITEHMWMEEEIRRRDEALTTLNDVSATAVSFLDLDTMLSQILERTMLALDAAAGSILLREPGTGELFFAVSLPDMAARPRIQRLAPGQGIAGWVVEHNQPIRVDDARCDPRWLKDVDAVTGFVTRSLACAPLTHRDVTAGSIEILNKREGVFTSEDLSLLVAVASIAAAALENARLYAASQSRIRELALLNEIGLTVTSSLEHATVTQAALSLIVHLFPADGIFLLQPDAQSGELRFTRAVVRTAPAKISLSLPPGEGIAGWVLEHCQAVLINDAQNDPRCSHRLDQHLGTRTRALMAAPLLVPDRTIGVLEVVSWQMSLYTSEDLRTLQSIASTLAVALENSRLYAEQKHLVHEREQAQTQLIHSEKMSALGRLASTIAHEINNPLQAIQGCLTLAGEELEGDQSPEKLSRYLGIVDSEIQRIATIGRRMREFYRPVRVGQVPTDVHAVLESVLDLSSKQLQQSDITVERLWARKLPLLQANPDHLRQVFLNLVLNAIDAMPCGGTLHISTALDQIQRDALPSRTDTRAQPVTAVRIDVIDTGVGMSPEVQARLFEPFFTSKEDGSGLGLSISYGIIETHGGLIQVESQQGEGTTFTILLPVVSSAPNGIGET